MAAQDRRGFLRAVGLAAAALPAARVLGANERVNLAVIGLGGRGRNHINEYAKLPGCRITAVCDIDQKALDDGAALVEKLQQERPKIYGDMRKLFADRDVDAVSLATPNHWHALGAIWACQAGKDVYVEKPACHNLWEGRKVVEAARKYQRIVQVGSQSRSIAHKRRAMQLLQEGVICDSDSKEPGQPARVAVAPAAAYQIRHSRCWRPSRRPARHPRFCVFPCL